MNFTYYLLFLFLLQTTAGEIIITLQDATENPIIEETIDFFPESSNSAHASCVTSEKGTCTITVDAPIDASGFIRGTVTFSSGARPVIWPGGTLELTLNTDSTGQLKINSDAYVTRTPKTLATETPVNIPKATEQEPVEEEEIDTATEQEPVVEEEEEIDTATEQEPVEEEEIDTATEQEPAIEEKEIDTATEQEPVVEEEEIDTRLDTTTEQEHSAPIQTQIFQGFLILILLSTLIFYFWKTKQ